MGVNFDGGKKFDESFFLSFYGKAIWALNIILVEWLLTFDLFLNLEFCWEFFFEEFYYVKEFQLCEKNSDNVLFI